MNQFKKYWKNWSTFSKLGFIFAIVIMCCYTPIGLFSSEKESISSNSMETIPIQKITSTAIQPTQKPTQRPISPSCQEIYETWDVKTDIQQNRYQEELEKYWINNWEGTIRDVEEGELFGWIDIVVDVNNCSSNVRISVDENIGLMYNKNQEIIFSGDIFSAYRIFDLVISVHNANIKNK